MRTIMKRKSGFRQWGARFFAALFALSMLLGSAACDGGDDATTDVVAEYGNYGFSCASLISLDYPLRGPFTNEEKAAAEVIRGKLEKLGYTPRIDTFTVPDAQGAALTSQNVVVTMPGTGFRFEDKATGETRTVHRQVVIGAHYDTWFSVPVTDAAGAPVQPAAGATFDESVAARDAGYDGINDNASGIGALMALANEMAGNTYGYDIVLVAFGAGSAGQAGARHFVGQMSAAQVSATDAMYCVEAIYAGDKLYASAGLNSIGVDKNGLTAKIYEKRRKLYEATDVAIENDLDEIGCDLLTNQSSIELDLNGDGVSDIYREVTQTVSDFSPFDAAGIPCVYIESFDYSFDTLEGMKDSKNPGLADFGGRLRNSVSDGYDRLSDVLSDRGQLQERINVTAFLLLEAVKKGNWEALP